MRLPKAGVVNGRGVRIATALMPGEEVFPRKLRTASL